jgi:hypothetical protein
MKPTETFPCSSIPLPLHPRHGGTGMSILGTFPIIFGGTGHSFIPKNNILIGNNTDKPNLQQLDGAIACSNSKEIISNKMIDGNYNSITNINLSKNTFQKVLSISNGGTGHLNTIVNSISFTVFNNGSTQNITQNPSTIINWNVLYDIGGTYNNFNSATGIYTIPHTGHYAFSWSVCYKLISFELKIPNNFFKTILVTPNNNFEDINIISNNNSIITTEGSSIIYLKKEDKIFLQGFINLSEGISTTVDNCNLTWFTGHLLSTSFVL